MKPIAVSIRAAFRSKWPNNNLTICLAEHLQENAINVKKTTHFLPADIISEVRSKSQRRQNAVQELWEQLETAMINAVYGSNMVETAGTSLDITINLCRAVFRGQDVSADIGEQDPTYAAHLQALVNQTRNADKDAVIESRADVINHAKAFNYMVERVVLNDEVISEEMIRETHRILAAGMRGHDDLILGEYRTHDVAIRYKNGKTSRTMGHKYVPQKMAQMVANLAHEISVANEAGQLDPYTLAARYHQVFVFIHPFADGNGRVSRIILNTLLLKFAGHICVIGLTKEDQEAYLAEVTKGCKKYHLEDDEVEHDQQKAHFKFAGFVLDMSMNSLCEMVHWLAE
ncbi:hypothetical protein NQ176_g5264 [Zarea fungicola]|uniref:Uncharacterized protein n=1 Tax=Zarea fungicola TaxID=93591 RepID=A0ACC1NAK1_9HYPO|nr:hypothetical protein NQ176_g5264 [Lecanicillium fungicola]